MSHWIIRRGVTDPVVFELQSVSLAGVVAPINLTGVTRVDLRIQFNDGSLANFASDDVSPQLTIDSPLSAGQVTFSPGATDLTVGRSHKFFFLVTDGAGKVSSFPHNRDAKLDVLATY